MCRLLGVSPSGYYAWVKRRPSRRARADAGLIDADPGCPCGLARHLRGSARSCRACGQGHSRWSQADRTADVADGLAGVSRRKFVTTTVKDGGRQAPDLVERNFLAERPDLLWVADITYIPTWAGFLYLAVVLDAFSRRIVGWSMGTTLATQLVLDALNMALATRRPNGVIHHSDSQRIGPAPGRPDSNTDRPSGRLAPQGAPVRSDPHSDRPGRVFPWICRPPGGAWRWGFASPDACDPRRA